jgi:hypothetical protein
LKYTVYLTFWLPYSGHLGAWRSQNIRTTTQTHPFQGVTRRSMF